MENQTLNGDNSSSSSVPAVNKAFDGILSQTWQHPDQDQEGRSNAYVALTYDKLDISGQIDRVRSSKAGAVVVFIGTTRDNFEGKEVKTLEYTTYPALALKSLKKVTTSVLDQFSGSVHAISVIHRLGIVPVGEDSIVIALSSSHRQEGWRAAEEALELVKDKVEVWKREWFVDGGVWKANRDGKAGKLEFIATREVA